MNIGDIAPEFSLPDQTNRRISLSEALGTGGLVVFFYPKDGTPLCAKEACAFRDNYGEFQKYGVNILGVSSDSTASHQRFAQDNGLTYPLLHDAGGVLRKEWGVPSSLGILPGRVTYVLDGSGKVRDIFSSQLEAERHVANALAVARKMAGET